MLAFIMFAVVRAEVKELIEVQFWQWVCGSEQDEKKTSEY